LEYLWITFGIILILAGVLGCFVPAIPGPPLAYVSLVLLQLGEEKPFTTKFLIIWALIVVTVSFLDYVIPPLATKKLGGNRKGVVGSTIGIFAGLFIFPPWGIIIFPFLGAFIGEMISGQEHKLALKAAMGSFLGFLTGVLLKLVVTVMIAYYFFAAIF
jgi:uncharacterized protein YqgC (DUF456 family)